ncbi:hypothetical protein LCGC14_2744850, partial [marine sediment metagenome]
CTLAAYAFARFEFFGRDVAFALVLVQLMIMPEVLIVENYRTMSRIGAVDTIMGIGLPYMASAFGIFLLRQTFKAIPRELEEAAMIDGYSRLGAFVKMVLPISTSGILTVVIFSFTLVIQEYIYTLTFVTGASKYTVSVGVPTFLVHGDVYNWGGLMAGVLITAIPITIVYNFFVNRFIAGLTLGAVKG